MCLLLTEALKSTTWVSIVLSVAEMAATLPVLFDVEVFAGEAELASAFANHVGPFEPFDERENPTHNISEPSGLKLL